MSTCCAVTFTPEYSALCETGLQTLPPPPPSSHCVNVFYSICFAETDVAIVKVSCFTAYLINRCCTFAPFPSGPIRKHLGLLLSFFSFFFFFSSPSYWESQRVLICWLGDIGVLCFRIQICFPSVAVKNATRIANAEKTPDKCMKGGLYNGCCCEAGWLERRVHSRVHRGEILERSGSFFFLFFLFLQHKGAGCEGLHTQYSGCLLLRLCLRSLFPLPINGKHWLSPPSVKIMTCNVSSRAHDNQTIVIKYYYLYYSKWYDKLFSVVPLFWMKRGRWYHLGGLLVLFHCILKWVIVVHALS